MTIGNILTAWKWNILNRNFVTRNKTLLCIYVTQPGTQQRKTASDWVSKVQLMNTHHYKPTFVKPVLDAVNKQLSYRQWLLMTDGYTVIIAVIITFIVICFCHVIVFMIMINKWSLIGTICNFINHGLSCSVLVYTWFTLSIIMNCVLLFSTQGDGRYLISNSKDQTIKLWDMRRFSSEEAIRVTKFCFG